jgi:hypothetical protein
MILRGCFVFIDIGRDLAPNYDTLNDKLIQLGAKIEKTLSNKLTHIIFFKGVLKTKKVAAKLNIPLVSPQWVYYCYKEKKKLNHSDYPPLCICAYSLQNIVMRNRVDVNEIKHRDPNAAPRHSIEEIIDELNSSLEEIHEIDKYISIATGKNVEDM